jgi:hypothetical protein
MFITAAVTPGFTDEVQQPIHALDFLSQVPIRERRRGSVVL